MRDQKLSVALAVYNEEDNLAACLETIKDIADEIVVVDGNSKDKTAEIAEHYHAKVIKVENKANFHINKQMAISACQYDWILQLDADEVVSPELSREIKSITYNNVRKSGDTVDRLKGEEVADYTDNYITLSATPATRN